MSLAREVNNLLDKVLLLKEEEENNPSSDDLPVNVYAEQLNILEKELNKVTNKGQNCKDLFTNIYYVNNFLMDKELNKTNVTTEEEIAHSLMEGLKNGEE